MDRQSFLFFYYLIMNSYVSVTNIPQGTTYVATIDNEESDPNNTLAISVSYSHSDAKNVYIKYSLYLYNDLVCQMSRPLFDTKKKQPIDIKRMEMLLQTCSAKIIAQERQAQKNHMLKTIFNRNSMERN